ncbi:putative membrane protein [Mycobacteroides abscessus 5S-0422]|uniref:Putative membrane protein n=2 Tax=Mycobacteroides abscessus TaxID=36809 RepID=X8DUT8_9MYCO|nr:putative membrane protein [Mycobacteroides abscessus 5S-0422]EIU21416.1 putative membrane protein [Mycobacteroides abscessus 5S-0708]EIU29377.1 putative membrane protein [Mycobacteroides abscessus 5S-1212]EUA71488.1 putative membrane protein [Mycobacteroides abscessus subsp. bolletii 1513]
MMRAPEPDFYIALMAAVIGGVSLFAEPRESAVQKWLYWAVAPAVAVVCISLVFQSVLTGLGLGAFVLLFLAMTYLRYKL